MNIFIALLFGLLAYVLANVILENVKSLQPRAELIAFIIGIVVTLICAGVVKF